MKRAGVSTTVQIVSVIVAFLIGLGIMYAAAPSFVGTKTSTTTVTTTSVSTATVTGGGSTTTTSSSPTSTSTSTSQTSSGTATGQPINVGIIAELTGSFGPLGSESAAAAKEAVTQINNNGGVDGRPINLIVLDDQTNPTQGVTDATQLATQNNVIAITGTTSSAVALAVRGYTEQNGIPYIVPIAQDPQLTAPNSSWTIRVTPDSVTAGVALAQYALQRYPNARVAIAETQIVYFQQIAKGFMWYMQNHSLGTVVYDQTFPASQSDFSTAVASIKAANPTVIFNDLVVPGTFFTELLQAGFNSSQIFAVTDEASNILPLGSQGAGVYTGSMYNIALGNSTNGVAAFNSLMTPVIAACSGCGKTVTEDSYFSYITMYMIRDALQNALSTGSLTRASFMAAMKNLTYQDNIMQIGYQFNQSGAAGTENYWIVQVTNVNTTAGTYTEKVVAHYSYPPGTVPAYQIATGSISV